jgi:hypothetical protein
LVFPSSLVCITIASILITSCVKKPIEGRADPYPAAQVHFASEDLRKHTAVGTPMPVRDEEGRLLYVTVPIRSASNMILYVDYRVTFFDKEGQPINQTTWFTKTLEANTPDQITVNSMSPRAADFQIDFRYAR